MRVRLLVKLDVGGTEVLDRVADLVGVLSLRIVILPAEIPVDVDNLDTLDINGEMKEEKVTEEVCTPDLELEDVNPVFKLAVVVSNVDPITEVCGVVTVVVLVVVLAPRVELPSLFCEVVILNTLTRERTKADVKSRSFELEALDSLVDLSLSLSPPIFKV